MDSGAWLLSNPTGLMSRSGKRAATRGRHFNVPNTMGWNELATRVVPLESFYTSLLGWQGQTDDQGYTVWMNNGRMNGGMMQIGDIWGQCRRIGLSISRWLIAPRPRIKPSRWRHDLERTLHGRRGGHRRRSARPTGASFMVIHMDSPDKTLPE
jgi:hypothetical protein